MYEEQFLTTDEELEQLALRLQRSDLFNQNTEYIRRQFVYCMLQVKPLPTQQIDLFV